MNDVESLLSDLCNTLNRLGCVRISLHYDGTRKFDAEFCSEIRQRVAADLRENPDTVLSIVRHCARYNGKDGHIEIYANHLCQRLSVCFYAGEYLFDIAIN